MSPLSILRIEGAFIFLSMLITYSILGVSWWMFFALLLIPDLFMGGYIFGPRFGAHVYNVGHTYTVPILIGMFAFTGGHVILASIAVIWTAHIGMDRGFGYGLKKTSGFYDTHLDGEQARVPHGSQNAIGSVPSSEDAEIVPRLEPR